MTIRKLSKEEIELNKKAIERMKKRNNYIQNYFIPKTKLELEYGLNKAFEETKDQYENAIKEWEIELKTNLQQIEILEKQIKFGVEEKKTPPGV